MRNEIVVQKTAGYVGKVLSYCKDYDYASFSADSKLVEACVFNLSQLRELCNAVSDEFVVSYRSSGGRCTVCVTVLSMIMKVLTLNWSGRSSGAIYRN